QTGRIFLRCCGGGSKMMNYLKSEQYRLIRKKPLHLMSIIACTLIIAFAFVLDYFGRNEAGFPYATQYFFYSNVVNGGVLLFIIILFVNISLTGKDLTTVKQSLSFGISRTTIFWSKLAVTFIYFLLLCLIGIVLMTVLVETLLAADEASFLHSFLIACVNMFPIVFSVFMLVHVLQMNQVNMMYTIIAIAVIYSASEGIVHLMFRAVNPLQDLY